MQTVRPFLLRRGTNIQTTGGSFKRRSLKLRRNTKDSKEIEAECKFLPPQNRTPFLTLTIVKLFNLKDPVKRTDSIQSRRKVSSLSDRSDNSEQGGASGGEEESPGILSDDQPPESPSDSIDETSKTFPWLRAVLAIMNSFNYYCTHQNFCHPYCFKRHMRAASRLMKSVRKVRSLMFILCG